jgi:hypothetical protein
VRSASRLPRAPRSVSAPNVGGHGAGLGDGHTTTQCGSVRGVKGRMNAWFLTLPGSGVVVGAARARLQGLRRWTALLCRGAPDGELGMEPGSSALGAATALVARSAELPRNLSAACAAAPTSLEGGSRSVPAGRKHCGTRSGHGYDTTGYWQHQPLAGA